MTLAASGHTVADVSTAAEDYPPEPPAFAGPTVRRVMYREVAAVILVVLGVAGLITAGFMVSVEAGIAACSLVAIAAGVSLGLDV